MERGERSRYRLLPPPGLSHRRLGLPEAPGYPAEKRVPENWGIPGVDVLPGVCDSLEGGKKKYGFRKKYRY